MDLSKSDTWFGKGTNTREENVRMHMSQKGKMGNIDQYGLLSYIISWILLLSCCFKFLSLEIIMVLAGVGGGVMNIASAWGLLMIFTTIRYFQTIYKN
jgi:hypothetical protein